MKLLTVTQVALELSISRVRVCQLIADGRLPATKFGRDWQIRSTDIDMVRDRPTGYPLGRKRSKV